MSTSATKPPFAGKTFEVRYDGLIALNIYAEDGQSLSYEIIGGDLKGAKREVNYEWKAISPTAFVITWQEADGATVVHIDDFAAQTSLSFYTTPTLDLYRLEGSLTKV
ncbi:MoaF-related domain-containing protein [Pseudomonas sp. SED1]|uniref:MoaF-related domain-containing protein n=1 Tax=Pseudomonas sp. SED1 TaxID=3056845 RepID=UPI00296ECB0B|nr:adenylate cyclase [Pseudomonas sp. SED1]MDY0836788.1 adenylate cyclase [Pseudomonas sp. SED1]